jgi:transposase
LPPPGAPVAVGHLILVVGLHLLATNTDFLRGLDNDHRRLRNDPERMFNRIKHFRGIATRYDKTAKSFQTAPSYRSQFLG